ncbi:Detected protein of unknown function [Hibiscus syriacus]|uniref:Uncharacterized protein n=1 Tax=Hibiscus syriacus TaxID=106335 RepID=A0A6A3CKE4_HIBSY|nr:uncharacterized protein LOC120181333 [Hibiscus syriacus]KAE8729286.1 Detected protein of unknown function [Hibiscus syriacus]
MIAPTKLAIVLIVIFATILLALFLELVYVLWRKRSFCQRSVISGGARSIDSEFPGSPFYATPSKDLLYFFCWKNQHARVEPSSGVVSQTPTEAATAPESVGDATEDDDNELAALYGQSRILYTIKEEEREGNDSVENSADQSEARNEKRACLRYCLSGGAELLGDVVVAVDSETPFSTPCASPPYFTPSPSPDRDLDSGLLIFSPETEDVTSPGDVLSDKEVGFVSLRIVV